MGNTKRSLVGHLTLTAWESWAAEGHWRNAVIIALVGSVAFSMSTPPATPSSQASAPTAPSNGPTSGSQASTMPSSMMNSNATILTPKSKLPPKLKPKITTDEVIISEAEATNLKKDNFGRSYGDN